MDPIRKPSRNPSRDAGFTLVELLIALAIFGIVIAHGFAVFSAQHLIYTGTERAIEVQEDVRLVANAVLSDLRMAGYMVPQEAGAASVDGGTSAADVLCVSDPAAIADAEVAAADARFDRAGIFLSVGASATTVQLSTGNLDVDGDSNGDFVIGAGLIIADTASSHCAKISAINPVTSTITFTPATPAGFSASATSGRVTPAVIYEVDAGGLARNGLRLATQVEDLQVEFGVDVDGDGQLGVGEFPLHDLNGSDPSSILQVRLSVIALADSESENLQTSGRPAAANRTGGPADGFHRRRVTASVLPRNLL